MNWSIRDKNAFAKWSVMFVLLGTSLAWANSGPKTSAPARSSAPSRPASAPKAAPAQRPGRKCQCAAGWRKCQQSRSGWSKLQQPWAGRGECK